MFAHVKQFILKYIKYASALAFVVGFVTDAYTLPSVTSKYALYIGIGYISAATFLFYLRELLRFIRERRRLYAGLYTLTVIVKSLVMGSLLSFVFVYYLRGSNLFVSWPILLFLFGAMLLNELQTEKMRVTIDYILYTIGSLFLAIFMVPVVMKKVSDETFVIATAVAISISLILAISIRRYEMSGTTYIRYFLRTGSIATIIPLCVAVLYFSNIIPAVPLSLSEGSIYTYVSRNPSTGEYTFGQSAQNSWNPLLPKQVTYGKGKVVYFYTRINAPTDLRVLVSHEWQYYDEVKNDWVLKQSVKYPISGGRADGYRGYSLYTNIEKGMWRINVLVDGKRSVGSVQFEVQ